MKSITVHNLNNLPTIEFDSFIALQDDLKYTSPEKNKKLQNRIKNVGFKYPVFAWKDEGRLYTVDAHQRLIALEELEASGYEIPPIPYVLVKCDNIDDAKKEILYLNSRYAEINPQSDFVIENFDIDLDTNIEIPKLNINFGDFDGAIDDFFESVSNNDNENDVENPKTLKCPHCGEVIEL
jgi:hypothetical protein